MRWAVCRAQVAALRRDVGALAMSFVLPALVFLVFAAIFPGGAGDPLRLTVVVADEVSSPLSRRLVAAIEREPGVVVMRSLTTAADAEAFVAAGGADAAIVLPRAGRRLDRLSGDGASPVQVLSHPARAMAGGILAGAIQRAYFNALPDAALRGALELVDEILVPLTADQRREADVVLDDLIPDPGASPSADAFSPLTESRRASGGRAEASTAAYYAAAVAALFVLLSAIPVAAALHESIASGAGDRALASPAGLTALVDGRAAFLVLLGLLQTAIIFVVSWVQAGLAPWAWVGRWSVIACGLAVASSGLSLLLAAACRTSRQALTLGNMAVLVVSAVGGSMVPRFLMPAWLQDLGWWTPNAWAIEGFAAAVRPVGEASSFVLFGAVLALSGLTSWLVARAQFVRRAVQ